MMTDAEFARAFERAEVAPADFNHRAHLRLAWVYLQEEPSFDRALSRIRTAIQQFAAAAGASQKYHETMTVAWMMLLEAERGRIGEPCSFEILLERAPHLGDTHLPLRHYTRERLFSDAARAGWIPPDIPI